MSSERVSLCAKRFSEKELKKLEYLEIEQHQFREWVRQSNEFSEVEKSTILYDTLTEFENHLTKGIEAKCQFDSCHDRAHGLRSKRHQSLSSVVQSFMDYFSPLVQIIKDLGAPYGGIAIATISVLVTVASSKEKTEGNLGATISGIKDRLPEGKLYRNLCNDKNELSAVFQAKILSFYESIIRFSIAATKYYRIGGPMRFLRALAWPDTLRAQVDEIQGLAVDIRRLCEEVLDENLEKMKQLNIKQETDIKNLEAQIEQLHVMNDNTRLKEVQQLLKFDASSEEQRIEEVQKYRRTLNECLDTEQFEQMREERLRTFENSDNYQAWLKSNQARMLVLSGYNERSILDDDQCWLSPIALNHIENLSRLGPAVLVYHLLPQKRETLVHHVIPPILHQLLAQKRQALRDDKEYGSLREELQRYEDLSHETTKDDMNEHNRIAILQNIALRIVSFFEDSEVVYIIVDRVDRCMDPVKGDHRKALMKILVKMVEGAKCSLKVLAVINGYDWRVEERQDEFGAEKKGSLTVHTERQCRIEAEA